MTFLLLFLFLLLLTPHLTFSSTNSTNSTDTENSFLAVPTHIRGTYSLSVPSSHSSASFSTSNSAGSRHSSLALCGLTRVSSSVCFVFGGWGFDESGSEGVLGDLWWIRVRSQPSDDDMKWYWSGCGSEVRNFDGIHDDATGDQSWEKCDGVVSRLNVIGARYGMVGVVIEVDGENVVFLGWGDSQSGLRQDSWLIQVKDDAMDDIRVKFFVQDKWDLSEVGEWQNQGSWGSSQDAYPSSRTGAISFLVPSTLSSLNIVVIGFGWGVDLTGQSGWMNDLFGIRLGNDGESETESDLSAGDVGFGWFGGDRFRDTCGPGSHTWPGSRGYSVVWTVESTEKVFMFGGIGFGTSETIVPSQMNDLWEIDLSGPGSIESIVMMKRSGSDSPVVSPLYGDPQQKQAFSEMSSPRGLGSAFGFAVEMTFEGIPTWLYFVVGGANQRDLMGSPPSLELYDAVWTFREVGSSVQWRFDTGTDFPNTIPSLSTQISITNRFGGMAGFAGFSVGTGSDVLCRVYGGVARLSEGTGTAADSSSVALLNRCYGVYEHELGVCSAHGSCYAPDECTCDPVSYYGDACEFYNCYTRRYDDPEVCSGVGECSDVDTCVCGEYYGDECESTMCFGHMDYDIFVCSGRGNCSFPDNCSCDDPDNWGGEDCSVVKCDGILATDISVCTYHGTCLLTHMCLCESPLFWGDFCQFTSMYCFEKLATDPNVCGGNGICVEWDTCACFSGWIGTDCAGIVCDGVLPSDENVCNGHGDCRGPNECDCDASYVGSFCDIHDVYCDGIHQTNASVCNGHGNCVEEELCWCSSRWVGEWCRVRGDLELPAEEGIEPWVFGLIGASFVLVCLLVLLVIPFLVAVLIYRSKSMAAKERETKGVPVIDSHSDEMVMTEPPDPEPGHELGAEPLPVGDPYYSPNSSPNSSPPASPRGSGSGCGSGSGSDGSGSGSWGVANQANVVETRAVATQPRARARTLTLDQALFSVPWDSLRIARRIGKGGSFSSVYLAAYRGKMVALKAFKLRSASADEMLKDFEREAQILTSLDHPNIIETIGCTCKPPRLGIVLEYCELGDLKHYFVQTNPSLPLGDRYRILHEIALGMAYCHDRSVIHRDIKSENVLLTNDLHPKLMDFGLGKIVERMSKSKTQRLGTRAYMAPEVVVGNSYDEKCDVFVNTLLSKHIHDPYGDDVYRFSIEFKAAHDPTYRPHLECERDLDAWFVKLMKTCWSGNPKRRPGFSGICAVFDMNAML